MRFPHCDARILHARGECTVCDTYASELHEIRDAWGINFTGHDDNDKLLLCPADVAREPDAYNAWYGNTRVTDRTYRKD